MALLLLHIDRRAYIFNVDDNDISVHSRFNTHIELISFSVSFCTSRHT